MLKHICGSAKSEISRDWNVFQIQPNALDLRLSRVWEIRGRFTLSEDVKDNLEKVEIKVSDEQPWFLLPKGSYEVQFVGSVKIAENEAGWVIPRSTLVRNGIFLQSGLYDSGYHGSVGASINVTTSSFKVRKGTRLGQLLIAEAEAIKKYDGSYGIGKKSEIQYS